MATIIPFKAVRPPKDKVSLVASRSYEDYSKKERKAQLQFNPFSFLHIVNPGYKFKKVVSGKDRFQLVKNRYLEFKEDGVFIKDKEPAIYIYKIKTRENSFCGFFAGASTADYEANLIKKHENTIAYREKLFKEYLKTVGFNAEPVLLTYPDNATVEGVLAKAMKTTPEYEFTTEDRSTHYIWKLSDEKSIQTICNAFKTIEDLYIADGHHRSASSYLLSKEHAQENNSHIGNESYNFFMSYFIPESNLKIHEFNRLVKDLNGLTKETFLIELDKWFRIENRGQEFYRPSKKHHFSMYLDGEFYSLYLRKTLYEFTDELSKLDAQILFKTILHPILGINDLRNDKRIDYIPGKETSLKIKNLVDSGEYEVCFGLVPVKIDELKNIADANQVMPPKSTYIEPKLRSGLTIYEF
jgi:uncharacterized protein (DUF1015 family)